jgi:hypothetical protein
MRREAFAAFSLAVIAGAGVLAPTTAVADGRAHGHTNAHRLHTVAPQHFPNRFHGSRTVIVGTPLLGYGYGYGFGLPSYAYAAPVPDDPPMYAPPPPVYSPSAAYPPPPPPPSTLQRTVEFPDGHYELRGDGITVPYRWVWIPNPPTSPPPDAVPPPPPAPVRRSDIYRWTDSDGVVHLTDRWEKVPEAYRAQAKKTQS